MTTFCCVCGALRIRLTRPWNCWLGNASTVKLTVWSTFDVADVGFRHRADDLHFRQVVCDHEKGGGAEAGGDRVADVDLPGDDHAVNGREDVAMGEIHLGQIQRRALDLHLRIGLKQLGLGGVKVGLGDETLLEELPGAFGVHPREFVVGFRVGELALGLENIRLVDRGIDLGDKLALLDRRIPVHVELGDDAGDLACPH